MGIAGRLLVLHSVMPSTASMTMSTVGPVDGPPRPRATLLALHRFIDFSLRRIPAVSMRMNFVSSFAKSVCPSIGSFPVCSMATLLTQQGIDQ